LPVAKKTVPSAVDSLDHHFLHHYLDQEATLVAFFSLAPLALLPRYFVKNSPSVLELNHSETSAASFQSSVPPVYFLLKREEIPYL
jgi:hypothetical protein